VSSVIGTGHRGNPWNLLSRPTRWKDKRGVADEKKRKQKIENCGVRNEVSASKMLRILQRFSGFTFISVCALVTLK